MSNENNNFDRFVKSGVLYRAFIPITDDDTFNPTIEYDTYAMSETEALEYLISEDDFSPKVRRNAIYEIPLDLRNMINKTNRQRLRIQQKLRTGSIDELRKIKLIFAEIEISDDDLHMVAEELREQGNDKYIGISLKDRQFTMMMREKYIKDIDRRVTVEINKLDLGDDFY